MDRSPFNPDGLRSKAPHVFELARGEPSPSGMRGKLCALAERWSTTPAGTTEANYNVPGMGDSYLRARQHRNVLSILPDGARVYEYHPWEKNVSGTGPLESYLSAGVPILEYLEQLEPIGEDVADCWTIWYDY